MKRFIRRRPSAGAVIAVIALIVALGGTAVAGGGFLTKKKFNKSAVKAPVQYVTTTISVPDSGGGKSYLPVSASCPAGTKVLGGGIKFPDPDASGSAYVADSYPTASGWAGHVSNYSGIGSTTASTTAICATVRSSIGTPPS